MTRETAYQEILRRTGLEDKYIMSAYMYGSRVYGTARKNSDWDFIVVLSPGYPVEPRNLKDYWVGSKQFSDNLININFYMVEVHRQRLEDHEPSAMETVWLPPSCILKETPMPEPDWLRSDPFDFLDKGKLRAAYSAKASNSWVKAKKKLTVPESYNDLVGKKSLWHSLRLLDFGRQIAELGEIADYESMNEIYDEVLYCNDWSEMFEKYKKLYNEMSTTFRKYAPKDVQES